MAIWAAIKGFDSTYWVSDEGQVRSIDRVVGQKNKYGTYKRLIKGCLLKPAKNNRGYLLVNLCKDGKQKGYLIHRLVAEAFVDNPDNLPEVNHKSEKDKTDNRAEALEWCDRKFNINYGTRTQRMAEKNTNGKCSKPVLQFDKQGNFLKEWPSMKEVERETGFFYPSVSDCCRRKRKSAYGYIWKFKEERAA